MNGQLPFTMYWTSPAHELSGSAYPANLRKSIKGGSIVIERIDYSWLLMRIPSPKSPILCPLTSSTLHMDVNGVYDFELWSQSHDRLMTQCGGSALPTIKWPVP